MSELMRMPIGFHFEPTDEELILGFLLPKVRGSPLPWNGILEKEIYGEQNAPWEVFKDVDDMYWHAQKESKGLKKTIYVFTKLSKATSNPKCKNKSRRAGCGTWAGQTGPKTIIDSSSRQIIGSNKMYSYRYSSGAADSFGHWIMHEYILDGSIFNDSDIVLCKITKTLKADDQTVEGMGDGVNKKRKCIQEYQHVAAFDCKKPKLCPEFATMCDWDSLKLDELLPNITIDDELVQLQTVLEDTTEVPEYNDDDFDHLMFL